MSLKSDIDEARELWKNASSLSKIFVVISTFLAISSVASLADRVFEWKGFILDGVEFYRAFINKPIQEFFERMGLVFERKAIDFLMVIILLNIAFMRGIWAAYLEYKIESIKRIFFYSIPAFIFCTVILIFWLAGINHDDVYTMSWCIVAFMSTFPILTFYSKSRKFAFYTPIIFSFIVILILGAINEGLERSI